MNIATCGHGPCEAVGAPSGLVHVAGAGGKHGGPASAGDYARSSSEVLARPGSAPAVMAARALSRRPAAAAFLADRHQPPANLFGVYICPAFDCRASVPSPERVGERATRLLNCPALPFAGVDPKEVYRAMLVREREHPPMDQTLSYLQYRTIIVDWMCEVAEEFKLNPYAVQLSVVYFDLTLQRVNVKKSQLQLVAMCCTLLAGACWCLSPHLGLLIVVEGFSCHVLCVLMPLCAAKFYGPEERVPSIADLNACSKNTYNRDGIVRMEVVILEALKWRTDELTPLHFVDHFLALRCVGAWRSRMAYPPHILSHIYNHLPSSLHM